MKKKQGVEKNNQEKIRRNRKQEKIRGLEGAGEYPVDTLFSPILVAIFVWQWRADV
jgi:hypothetical protein